MLTNVPTDLLRAFVTVVDLGSYTKAAEVLGRTEQRLALLAGAEGVGAVAQNLGEAALVVGGAGEQHPLRQVAGGAEDGQQRSRRGWRHAGVPGWGKAGA